jgi:hypothetical protein
MIGCTRNDGKNYMIPNWLMLDWIRGWRVQSRGKILPMRMSSYLILDIITITMIDDGKADEIGNIKIRIGLGLCTPTQSLGGV